MPNNNTILQQTKASVLATELSATVILYRSYAHGNNRPTSDIDILVLVDKSNLTKADQKGIQYPLYDIEFETGILISPMVLLKKDWEAKHHFTPFDKNIINEGQLL